MVKETSMEQTGQDCQICLMLPLHVMEMILQAADQLANFSILHEETAEATSVFNPVPRSLLH